MDPNNHDTRKPRGGRPHKSPADFLSRVMKVAKKYDTDTQQIRAELVEQLKALAEMAQQKALDTHPKKWKEKQNWARIAAYISQVINSIAKTYDEIKLEAEIEELRKMIEEEAAREERRERARRYNVGAAGRT